MVEENKELKEILKWSLRLQEKESTIGESINPERMQFLQDALADICNQPNETDLLKAALVVLKVDYENSLGKHSYGTSHLQEAFEQIQYLIEDIDHANNLQPLGGVEILLQYLKHKDHKLIELSCGAIAAACQNNIKCQEVFCCSLPRLLILIKDESISEMARTKALAAVSSVVRGFPPGHEAFFKHGGLASLISCLDSGFDKLTTKGLFLLSYFYRSGSEEALNVCCHDVLCKCTSCLSVAHDPQIVSHTISLLNTIICNHGNQYQKWKGNYTKLFEELRTSVTHKCQHFELYSEEETLSLMSYLNIKL